MAPQPDRNFGSFAGSAFVRTVQECRSACGPWRLQSLLRPVQDFGKRDQYWSRWCYADGLRGTSHGTGDGIFLSPRASKILSQRQNKARAIRCVRQRAVRLDTDRLGLIVWASIFTTPFLEAPISASGLKQTIEKTRLMSLSGVKRTWSSHRKMSAFDPKRTCQSC